VFGEKSRARRARGDLCCPCNVEIVTLGKLSYFDTPPKCETCNPRNLAMHWGRYLVYGKKREKKKGKCYEEGPAPVTDVLSER